MAKGMLFLMVGAMLGSAAPVSAQFDQAPTFYKGSEADYVFARTVTCVAVGEKARSAAIFMMEPDTEATIRALVDLLDRAVFCAPPAIMRAHPVVWRGALAEAVYLRNYKIAPVSMPVPAAHPDWLASPRWTAYAVAQCSAERAPATADRLIRAKRRSPEEVAAVNDLLPALRACGNGQKIRFDRVTVHGLVAEGLFRARGGTAGAGGLS